MRSARIQLQSGTLWPAIRKRSEETIRSCGLHSIETKQDYVEERGVRFLVRSVSNLARKEAEKKKAAASDQATPPFNPFLSPEPELTVAEISPTHLAILDKLNVIDDHLLIITREFEHQETLLNLNDFEALWVCMAEFGGLGFYNGGRVATPHGLLARDGEVKSTGCPRVVRLPKSGLFYPQISLRTQIIPLALPLMEWVTFISPPLQGTDPTHKGGNKLHWQTVSTQLTTSR